MIKIILPVLFFFSSASFSNEVFLDCPSKVIKTIGDIPDSFKTYQTDGYLFKVDLDMDNKKAKMPDWSNETFIENPPNPAQRFFIDADKVYLGDYKSSSSFVIERATMKLSGSIRGKMKHSYGLFFEGVCTKVETRANPDAKF